MVSVIVICHNYGRYLNKCVNSILRNDKSYISEIIIINDYSDDNTEEVAKKLKKKTKKIKYFKKKFRSLSKSINFGVRKSTGNWITKIDADDYVSKNFIKNFFKELMKKNLDFICGNIIEINNKEKKLKVINQNFKNFKLFKYPVGSGTIFNKKLWSAVGGFDETLTYQDDFDFWLKVKKKKEFNKGYINQSHYFYKRHNLNMSNNLIKKYITKIYVILKNLI
jgi:glycosyltransferase involved in cell wall biosynthesis